jgi:hypothetical protein
MSCRYVRPSAKSKVEPIPFGLARQAFSDIQKSWDYNPTAVAPPCSIVFRYNSTYFFALWAHDQS